MFLHIKFPLTLLKDLFSSLTTAVEITGKKRSSLMPSIVCAAVA